MIAFKTLADSTAMSGHMVSMPSGVEMVNAEALPSTTLRSSVEALAALPTIITKRISGLQAESTVQGLRPEMVYSVCVVDLRLPLLT